MKTMRSQERCDFFHWHVITRKHRTIEVSNLHIYSRCDRVNGCTCTSMYHIQLPPWILFPEFMFMIIAFNCLLAENGFSCFFSFFFFGASINWKQMKTFCRCLSKLAKNIHKTLHSFVDIVTLEFKRREYCLWNISAFSANWINWLLLLIHIHAYFDKQIFVRNYWWYCNDQWPSLTKILM